MEVVRIFLMFSKVLKGSKGGDSIWEILSPELQGCNPAVREIFEIFAGNVEMAEIRSGRFDLPILRL